MVAGAVLLAAVPLYVLDRAFEAYMERAMRNRLMSQASGALALAETRLDQAAKVIEDLTAAGIEECGPRALQAMRLAVFTTTPLKGLSLTDDQGRELCTHVGEPLDSHVVSEEYPVTGTNITLAAARFRVIDDRAVRLRLERASGRSVAALVAVDALLPDLDMEKGGGGRRLRLAFASGEVVAVRPDANTDRSFDSGPALTTGANSKRYPISIVGEISRDALAREFHGLQVIARSAMLVLLGFGAAMVWMSLRRNGSDPASELHRALHAGEIIPYYQPTVDTRNGRIRGAEVLARWKRPDGTLVSPAHFIPLAEQSGLIFELTEVLMRRAIEDMAESYRDRPRLRLAFNVFPGHFADARIAADVSRIFADAPIRHSQVVLEVTERSPLADLDNARKVIERLQAMGVKVAIDDVGTGHGGLSYLLKLGVDILKIDKMFVDAIGTEGYAQSIIELLAELGRTMKMEVIAEGVELVEQVEYLRQKGVTEAQGYVFAPPLPAGSYIALVEAMERPQTTANPHQIAGAA